MRSIERIWLETRQKASTNPQGFILCFALSTPIVLCWAIGKEK